MTPRRSDEIHRALDDVGCDGPRVMEAVASGMAEIAKVVLQ